MLVIVTILESGLPVRPEIVTAGHLSEVHQVAGVQALAFGGRPVIHGEGFCHPVAITGGTNHSTGATI